MTDTEARNYLFIINDGPYGLEPEDKVEGVIEGNTNLEGEWTLAADQILVF